jgi:hypothetical protein
MFVGFYMSKGHVPAAKVQKLSYTEAKRKKQIFF